jgi:hypothetical protein
MELIVDGDTVSQQPTDVDVTHSLSKLGAGEHDTVVLDYSERRMLVQVARGGDGAFILEVIDSNVGNALRSAEHFLDSGTVTDVFLSILEGNNRWLTATKWATSSSPVGAGQSGDASRSVLAIVIALAVLIAAIAAVVAQVGSQ